MFLIRNITVAGFPEFAHRLEAPSLMNWSVPLVRLQHRETAVTRHRVQYDRQACGNPNYRKLLRSLIDRVLLSAATHASIVRMRLSPIRDGIDRQVLLTPCSRNFLSIRKTYAIDLIHHGGDAESVTCVVHVSRICQARCLQRRTGRAYETPDFQSLTGPRRSPQAGIRPLCFPDINHLPVDGGECPHLRWREAVRHARGFASRRYRTAAHRRYLSAHDACSIYASVRGRCAGFSDVAWP